MQRKAVELPRSTYAMKERGSLGRLFIAWPTQAPWKVLAQEVGQYSRFDLPLEEAEYCV